MTYSKLTERDLMPVRTATYSENEATLINMIEELIHHAENDTLKYKQLEKARKLVWKIKTEMETPIPQGTNLYDKL